MDKNLLNKLGNLKNNRIVSMLLPVVWLLLLVIIFGIATGGKFFRAATLKIIINQTLVVATVATGASFVYGTGNVNIAMGATTGMIAAIIAVVFRATQSVVLMVIVALVVGIAVGVLAVIVSSKFRVKVLYVTVVMMTLLVAVQQAVLEYQTINISAAQDALQSINFLYIAYVVFMVACIIIFNFTKIGRGIKFIGTNDNCATATGLVNDRYLLVAFIIAGIGAAIGALMLVARSGSVGADTANTINMDVMLAIVLGGMSVYGGSKSYIWSATLGAITVVVLNAGLQMMGVDSIIIQGIRGVFFLVLVIISQTRTNLLPEKE